MMNVGGKTVTDYLSQLLFESHPDKMKNFSPKILNKIVNDIKEKECYVSKSYEEEIKNNNFKNSKYELPDGETIEIGKDRFECCEIMFQPNIIEKEIKKNLIELIEKSVESCPAENKSLLLGNILLGGGNTMFAGFSDRLVSELSQIYKNEKINVKSPPERKFTVWIGASILTTLSSFNGWIDIKEYKEKGVKVIDSLK